MKARFDVAVVGGGPAGAAAALGAARRGLSVALFEPQAVPDKPCGEGIMPSGVHALRELGLASIVERAQPLERVGYVLSSGRELEVELPEAGCALERPDLARALAGALASEPGILRFERKVATTAHGQGFRLIGEGEVMTASALIAADGLHGRAAAWLRRTGATRRRLGLRARAQARRPLRRVEVHLGAGSEVYLTPLPQGRVNVAVLVAPAESEKGSSALWLERALDEHPRVREVLGPWTTPPESRALHRPRPRIVAERATFLAGDAAGGVDPVLGCGVAVALSTGLAAGRAAARVVRGEGEAPERDYALLVARETKVRRAAAACLTFLAGHPLIQELFAASLGRWPGGARRLARSVARV
jgi:2-polyprenyl-6-methoxyphenol hydroxylase-like FAD-dependent oxidoreductase